MYECQAHSIIFTWSYYYNGCPHCFNSKDEFRKYLEDNGVICVESDFIENNRRLIF